MPTAAEAAPAPTKPVFAAFYSVLEFAQLVGISESLVWRLIKEGKLARVRIASKTLIPYSQLERIGNDELATTEEERAARKAQKTGKETQTRAS